MSDNNTNDMQGENVVEEAVQQQAFGTALKEAREAAGLSILEVSEDLKLPEETIRALESSLVESLPASTFTQGYIRNYARLLKIPAENVLNAYNRLQPEEQRDLTPTSGVPAQKSSHDILVKLTSYGLVVVIIMLLAFWWLQQESEQVELIEQQSEVVIEAAEESDLKETEMQAEPEQFVDVAPEPVVEQEAEPSQQPIIAKQEVEKKQEVSSKPEQVQSQTTRSETVVPGDDVIEMTTESESWTEIQDGNGRRLFFKLMESGEHYRVQGTAPFRIFLGNAPSVKISINNQNVNISSYIRRNNIAHFMMNDDATLDPVSQNATVKDTEPTEAVDSSRDMMFESDR